MYPRNQIQWTEGDIAYLKDARSFSARDQQNLINSGYLPARATSHPVIVLKAWNGQAMIIPVSAYSSGADNNNLPPWQQRCHIRKRIADFHYFVGSAPPPARERNGTSIAPTRGLTLLGGAQMPKPKVSWVNLQSVWTVPFSALGYFNKSPTQLRLDAISLQTIRVLLTSRCKKTTMALEHSKFLKPQSQLQAVPTCAATSHLDITTAVSNLTITAASRPTPFVAVIPTVTYDKNFPALG